MTTRTCLSVLTPNATTLRDRIQSNLDRLGSAFVSVPEIRVWVDSDKVEEVTTRLHGMGLSVSPTD